jgi:hypothetical protein
MEKIMRSPKIVDVENALVNFVAAKLGLKPEEEVVQGNLPVDKMGSGVSVVLESYVESRVERKFEIEVDLRFPGREATVNVLETLADSIPSSGVKLTTKNGIPLYVIKEQAAICSYADPLGEAILYLKASMLEKFLEVQGN